MQKYKFILKLAAIELPNSKFRQRFVLVSRKMKIEIVLSGQPFKSSLKEANFSYPNNRRSYKQTP
jgi:hypothetical protein